MSKLRITLAAGAALLVANPPAGTAGEASAARAGKENTGDGPAAPGRPSNGPMPAPAPPYYSPIIHSPKPAPDEPTPEQLRRAEEREERARRAADAAVEQEYQVRQAREARAREAREQSAEESFLRQHPFQLAAADSAEPNPGFANRLSDGASRLLQAFHNSAVEKLDQAKQMVRPDQTATATKYILNGGEAPPSRTVWDRVRNATVNAVSDAFSSHLKEEAEKMSGAESARGDTPEGAQKELDEGANPQNIVKGLKTYLDEKVQKGDNAIFTQGANVITAPPGESK